MSEQEKEPQSLWGQLPLNTTLRPPVVFLREQAAALNKETQGLLRGEVLTLGARERELKAALDIVVPALNDYRFRLIVITHDVRLYPVEVVDYATQWSPRTCGDEEQYVAFLKEILTSPDVHQIIASLIAQVKSAGG